EPEMVKRPRLCSQRLGRPLPPQSFSSTSMVCRPDFRVYFRPDDFESLYFFGTRDLSIILGGGPAGLSPSGDGGASGAFSHPGVLEPRPPATSPPGALSIW